ncbi:hypothetical protein MY10362_008722 [Beauveria mimosiformis]
MHFSAPLVLLTAITGAHALLLQRDTKPFIKAFKDVEAKVDDLDIAFQRWISDPAAIVNATSMLVATIEQSTSTVQGCANLTLNEALSLYPPVSDLKTRIQVLVDHINENRKDFRKARLCHVISSQITSIIDKSEGLAGATISKVPPGAQHLAKTKHAQEIFRTFATAAKVFSADNCKHAKTANVTTARNFG